MGSKASPPPAPDYAAAAQAQGAANKEAAQASGFINNPNIVNPYGSQTVTWGSPNTGAQQGTAGTAPQFNQSAYDNAMQQWAASQGQMGEATIPNTPAPSRDQFMTPGTPGTPANASTGMLQPTVTQTLNPEEQKILDANRQIKLGLANTGTQALNTVKGIMGTPFNYDGKLQTSLGSQGQIQDGIAPAGPINQGPQEGDYGLAGADVYGGQINNGPRMGQFGYAQQSINNPNVQMQLDKTGIANLPVNAGMTGQNAIMSRLAPQIQQQDQQYAAQLANQGITQGSEAYNNAMRVHNQAKNDLLTQAALQGIGLDFQGNQQGMANALNTGNFANSAAGQQFGQNMGAAQLYNAGQGQNYNQALATQAANNAAQGQRFGQSLSQQQLRNQAIAQNFGQGLAASQNQNAAQNQLYNQNLGAGQFANQAQNQGFNQGLASAQFGNTAQQQALQQAIAMRELPLNEISALMSGSQVTNPQFQQYVGGGQVQPAPIMQGVQNQYNSALQGYGMENQANNSFMSGLMGMGAYGLAGPLGGLIAKKF